MLKSFITISILLALTGCETAQERMEKAMETQIQQTIQDDWHDGIPLDGLFEANNSCTNHPALKGCNTVKEQLQDIAVTLASCRTDQRSLLCKAVVDVIGGHHIVSILPKANAVELPENPFYWRLPTEALQAQAGNFAYRKEVASWWWESWRAIILSCSAMLALTYAVFLWWKKRETAKRRHAAKLAHKKAERLEMERKSREQAEQAQAEAERQAQILREAERVEQERIAEELAEKQKAAEAAAKLAAEKTEAESLLKAAFASPKEKRRKNAPSPK